MSITDKSSHTDILKGQIKEKEAKETQRYLTELRLEEAKELSELKEENESIRKYYSTLRFYTKMIALNKTNGVIVTGEGGLSKSYTIYATLSELNFVDNQDYLIVSGYLTPLELFKMLYQNRDKKLIIFDDTYNLLEDKKCVSFLKQAMWSVTEKRFVSYFTSSEKLDVPEKFEIKASIMIITNSMPSETKDFNALLSRCVNYDLRFTFTQKMEIFEEISKKPYKDLSDSDRKMVFQFLKSRVSRATKELSIRTLFKLMDIFSFDRDSLETIGSEMLAVDELKQIIVDLIDEKGTETQKAKKFKERSGQSERQYWRLKKKMSL